MKWIIYWMLKCSGVFRAANINSEEERWMATKVVFTLVAFIVPIVALLLIFW